MRIFSAVAVVLLTGSTLSFSPAPVDGACCVGAKCKGDADCKACSNCKNCGHCKAGGACGVCDPGMAASEPEGEEPGDDAESSPAGGTIPRYPAFKKPSRVYEVVRVVDGDTIVVKLDGENQSVRLIGIDTPETVRPNSPVEEFGREASAFTTNLLAGESVWLAPDQGRQFQRDALGRVLAHVYRVPDGLWVNLEVVRQGYGHANPDFPFRHEELFKAYESRARDAGKGLWAKKD